MSAVVMRPLAFTVSGSSTSVGAPSNLNIDTPGLVWRVSGTTAFVIVDMGTASYDTVAITGTNLRPSDTVQIRTGTTTTGTGAYAGVALPAYAGVAPEIGTSIVVQRIGTRSERYIRIDISAPSIPDGFIQAIRLVVGRAITTAGVNYGATQGVKDRGDVKSGPGYRFMDRRDKVAVWKFKCDFITDTSWRTEWWPMLRWAGQSENILFIPDDTDPVAQSVDAIFGFIAAMAQVEKNGYNANSIDMTIEAVNQ